ncbi:unnamed protein product [Clonostachys byssicola]|uniref:N-acetyltransferase domain-containing protein n=1 Tax=Clonostachys byssicola TaxID=160290 RepID=A0A9N9UJY6_9HYPO|nr:unnamed protein product [Clonostachys byssicola]
MSSVEIRLLDQERDENLAHDLVQLQIDCITSDGALLRFHPPFDDGKRQQMQLFWEDRFRQCRQGLRVSFLAVEMTDSNKENFCGVVELGLPVADTGPFRADVEMLMVSPHHRRKGIAKKLLSALESYAEEKERTLLQLSTDAGSTAATHVYPAMGYIKFGTVPDYGIKPDTAELVAGEYFYKDLRKSKGSTRA